MLIETKSNLYFAIIIRYTHFSRAINTNISPKCCTHEATDKKRGENQNLTRYILVLENFDSPYL